MTVIISRLKELYQSHRLPLNEPGDANIVGSMFADVERHPPNGLDEESLEKYGGKERGSLTSILARITGGALIENFGTPPVLWTIVNYSTKNRYLAEKIGAYSGYTGAHPDWIEKARLYVWKTHRETGLPLVRSNIDVIAGINGPQLQQIDIRRILAENPRPGVKPSNKRLNDYSLSAVNTESVQLDGYSVNTDDIYLDAPTAIALEYKGQPNAIVGVTAEGDRTLEIRQLQGVRVAITDYGDKNFGKTRSSRGLAPFDWQQVLVGCASELGRKVGLERISIITGLNNQWTRIPNHDGTPRLDLRKAVDRYDAVAHRLGFKQLSNNDWVKDL